jgi:molybdopterin-guanine dinucleotide biosynthesis protein
MPSLKNPYCDVIFMGSPEEAEYAKSSYSFVIYVVGPDSRLSEYGEQYADRVIQSDDFDPENLVPDAAVEAFVANEPTLQALGRMLALLGSGEPFLNELCELLVLYRNKDAMTEKKIDPDAFVTLLREKERELNKRISQTITEGKIGITSSHFLELISSLGSCDDPEEALKRSLPAEFDEMYLKLVRETLATVQEQTGLDASTLFPQSFAYPVAIDSEKLYDLRAELASSDFKAQYQLKKKIARYARNWKDIHRLLRDVIEYDFSLGMGRFVSERGCTRPDLGSGGLSFKDATSIFFPNAVPISYKIGDTPHDFATCDNITVLTGANSGGKTTLLETALACQLMAQMGMLVPAASMHTCRFDKIRYQAKAKSQNAGAFETTISRLVPLATEAGRRLVLIDELESITEPGSAARIIASLIETMQEESDAFAIIVTHLGEEIAELCKVRIDGIEAKGLDDDLNLIVDRQPSFCTIGRSTPELIVEKLFRKANGDEKRVYEAMLRRIKE